MEQKNFDILNLVQVFLTFENFPRILNLISIKAERNHAITWENYENSILDLLNVLMGEDENYQCGKFIIQIIELHKRFFERAQKAIRENNNKQEISSLQKKAAVKKFEFVSRKNEIFLTFDNEFLRTRKPKTSSLRKRIDCYEKNTGIVS